ncbi:MAG: acyltransferase [Wenzhouxiangellaceae bacterium]|nr:acyltransferase [Wenzhouxiangellaceae bacterium]
MLPKIRVLSAFLLLSINSIVHILPLLVVAIVKLVLPLRPVRKALESVSMSLAASWIGFNSFLIDRLTSTRIKVSGEIPQACGGHFLVLSNHQSWVDIPVLQKLFNRRLPLLRFFLKSQLIWVPLLGLAWWALDFPFMKRYSREKIARHPELAGRDIAATRRACRKFRDIPVSIMNFVEGTRFNEAKKQAAKSPYRHLLPPRAGGVAFVLDAMGDVLDTIIDVTIVYPAGRPTMIDLFADRIPEIRVDIRQMPVPDEFRRGDYQNDPAYRKRFQEWINSLWRDKDDGIEQML